MSVEQRYRLAMSALSGRERLERTFALFDDVHAMLCCQLRQQHPELQERELWRAVAKRLYLTDSRAQALLKAAP